MSTVAIKTPSKKPATKPNVKALKKANKVATKSLTEKRGRPGAYSDEQKITLLVKENPHRDGTETSDMFKKIQKCKTVGEFFSKGGSQVYLRWFLNHDEISVK